jgi:hypoxanthine phosphoribosyltransferase
VLLNKEARRRRSLSPDYVGFTVTENLFLLGYGLDLAEKYRGLPYVAYLKEE